MKDKGIFHSWLKWFALFVEYFRYHKFLLKTIYVVRRIPLCWEATEAQLEVTMSHFQRLHFTRLVLMAVIKVRFAAVWVTAKRHSPKTMARWKLKVHMLWSAPLHYPMFHWTLLVHCSSLLAPYFQPLPPRSVYPDEAVGERERDHQWISNTWTRCSLDHPAGSCDAPRTTHFRWLQSDSLHFILFSQILPPSWLGLQYALHTWFVYLARYVNISETNAEITLKAVCSNNSAWPSLHWVLPASVR